MFDRQMLKTCSIQTSQRSSHIIGASRDICAGYRGIQKTRLTNMVKRSTEIEFDFLRIAIFLVLAILREEGESLVQ